MQHDLPRRTQRLIDQYLKETLTFNFLLEEFLFLRRFIMSNDVIVHILQKYYKEQNDALFGKLKQK